MFSTQGLEIDHLNGINADENENSWVKKCWGCGQKKECDEWCFWCETRFCVGCIANQNGCFRKNKYLVCKDCGIDENGSTEIK